MDSENNYNIKVPHIKQSHELATEHCLTRPHVNKIEEELVNVS